MRFEHRWMRNAKRSLFYPLAKLAKREKAHYRNTMTRDDVIGRLKAVEPVLRARGVGALYLFGSFARDEASPQSDIDIFLDAESDRFYELSNFMGAFGDLEDTFPGVAIGYATREGLSKYVRAEAERQAVNSRVSPRACDRLGNCPEDRIGVNSSFPDREPKR